MATDSKHAASEEENAVAAADDATALNSASEPDAEESQKDHEGSGYEGSQTVTAPDVSTSPDVVAQSSREPRVKTTQSQFTARGAIENRMKPRVDKLRKVSSVVLDEAAYDSSFRFILVVGVLFALFLVLLLLSKWIG